MNVRDDSTVEHPETFNVKLSLFTGSFLGGEPIQGVYSEVNVTIQDDDCKPLSNELVL